MYHPGEYVVRNGCGVCRVKEVTYLGARQYYTLVPLSDQAAKLYVPVDLSDTLLRDVLTAEDAWRTIQSIPSIEGIPIENDKDRERSYKDALHSGSPLALIQVIKRIRQRNQQRASQGKSVMDMDKRYCKLALDKLHEELAFALGKEKSEMPSLIQQAIQNH